jgi:hypothetical protein
VRRDVSAVLSDIGGVAYVHESAEGLPMRYCTPFFAFEDDSAHRIVVAEAGTGTGELSIALTLLVSPLKKVREIERFLGAASSVDPSSHPPAEIADTLLTPFAFRYLTITQNPSGEAPVCFPPMVLDTVTRTVRLVSMGMPAAAARKVASMLRAGTAVLSFSLTYALKARSVLPPSAGRAVSIPFKDTPASSELLQAPKTFSWEVVPGRETFAQGVTVVLRDQKLRFARSLRHEVLDAYDLRDDSEIEKLLERMNEYIRETFQQNIIVAGPDFAADIAHLSGYGISSLDVTPEEINARVSEVERFFRGGQSTFNSLPMKPIFSLLGFGCGAAGVLTRDHLQTLMQEKGWKFERDDKHLVPKSLEVYIVRREVIRRSVSVGMKVTRRGQPWADESVSVTTDRRLCP